MIYSLDGAPHRFFAHVALDVHVPKDIPSYGSHSKLAKVAIH